MERMLMAPAKAEEQVISKMLGKSFSLGEDCEGKRENSRAVF